MLTGARLERLRKAYAVAIFHLRLPTRGVFGEAKRHSLIDAATMPIYSRTGTQTIKMQMEVPGHGKVMATMEEKREYTFDYPIGLCH